MGNLAPLVQALAQAAAALAEAAKAFTLARPASAPARSFPLPLDTPALVDLVNDFLKAKARAGKSDGYLQQIRIHLAAFVAGRARRPADSITPEEVEAWLATRGNPTSQANALRYVRLLYHWANRRGLVTWSPAATVQAPRALPQAPRIHSPGEVERILALALRQSPGEARFLAVRYFAGLRGLEAARFDPAHILGDCLEVPAANAKTRTRRLVPVTPALAAWLDLDGPWPGPDRCLRCGPGYARAAGVTWSAGVTRHSFVSYRLAATGSAAQTALEAGHAEGILFRNYRAVVTPEAAARFWSIRPG